MVRNIRPTLTVVDPTTPRPPGKFDTTGADLWRRITSAYNIDDEGGREMLYQACCAADRIAQLRQGIARDGATVMTRTGPKIHPALKAELEQRAFIVRTLQRLGLDVEPVRPTSGRPGSGIGIIEAQEGEED
jgi:hypothetical protein